MHTTKCGAVLMPSTTGRNGLACASAICVTPQGGLCFRSKGTQNDRSTPVISATFAGSCSGEAAVPAAAETGAALLPPALAPTEIARDLPCTACCKVSGVAPPWPAPLP